MWNINLQNCSTFLAKVAKIYTLTNSEKYFSIWLKKSGRPDLLVVVVVVNLYLTTVILSEYLKVYLLSIGALIKLIYKYDKS